MKAFFSDQEATLKNPYEKPAPRLHSWVYLVLAVVLTAWLLTANTFIHPARFDTNDDPAIAAIAYGVNGEYDSHLIFVNILWGRFLVFLLSAFPQVAWYTVLECAVVAASVAAILFLLFQRFGLRNAWLPIAFLMFFFSGEYFSQFQFSRVAGIACIAGMLLLFYFSESMRHWPAFLIGNLLCAIGTFYRFEVFEMLLIPFAGVGLFIMLHNIIEKDWLGVFRLFFSFAMALLLCTALNQYDVNAYNNEPAWKEYREFNYLRAELLDRGFPDYDKNTELYESLNISKSDLVMYTNWDFDDPEIFTLDALKQLVAAKEPVQIDRSDSFLHKVIPQMMNYSFMSCLAVALAICLTDMANGALALLVYELLAMLGIEFLFLNVGRLGSYNIVLLPRLDVSLFFAVSVILFYYGYAPEREIKRRAAIALAAATMLGTLLFNQDSTNTAQLNMKAVDEKEAYALMHEDQKHFYAYTTTAFNDLGFIWENRPLGSRSNSIALGGWKTHTPTRQFVLDSHNIANPFRDVVDNPGMYLLSSPNGVIEVQLDYIKNHYEPEAQSYCVRIMQGGYCVYRICSTAPIPDLEREIENSPRMNFEVLSFSKTKDKTIISGQLYVSGEKCVDTTLYMRITDAQTNSTIQIIPQVYLKDVELKEGKYSGFQASIPEWQEGCQITFYAETPSGVYSVQMDPELRPSAEE